MNPKTAYTTALALIADGAAELGPFTLTAHTDPGDAA